MAGSWTDFTGGEGVIQIATGNNFFVASIGQQNIPTVGTKFRVTGRIKRIENTPNWTGTVDLINPATANITPTSSYTVAVEEIQEGRELCVEFTADAIAGIYPQIGFFNHNASTQNPPVKVYVDQFTLQVASDSAPMEYSDVRIKVYDHENFSAVNGAFIERERGAAILERRVENGLEENIEANWSRTNMLVTDNPNDTGVILEASGGVGPYTSDATLLVRPELTSSLYLLIGHSYERYTMIRFRCSATVGVVVQQETAAATSYTDFEQSRYTAGEHILYVHRTEPTKAVRELGAGLLIWLEQEGEQIEVLQACDFMVPSGIGYTDVNPPSPFPGRAMGYDYACANTGVNNGSTYGYLLTAEAQGAALPTTRGLVTHDTATNILSAPYPPVNQTWTIGAGATDGIEVIVDGVLSVVDDTEALRAAGLLTINPTGKVYEYTLAADKAIGFARFLETPNPQGVGRIYARAVTGSTLSLTMLGANPAPITGKEYAVYETYYDSINGKLEVSSTTNAELNTVRFFLPELYEVPDARVRDYPPFPVLPSTTLSETSVSRTIPPLPLNDFCFQCICVPDKASSDLAGLEVEVPIDLRGEGTTGSVFNELQVRLSNNGLRLYRGRDNATGFAVIEHTIPIMWSAGERLNIVVKQSSSGITFWVNGGTVANVLVAGSANEHTDDFNNPLTQLGIGNEGEGERPFHGTVEKSQVFYELKSDAELQALSAQ
jgi:hypothetical protein